MSDKSGVRLWLPLDRRLGPARRISSVRAANMVDAVIERAVARRFEKSMARGSKWRTVLLVTAASFALPLAAAVYFGAGRQVPAPTAVSTGAVRGESKQRGARSQDAPAVRGQVLAVHPGAGQP